jgi:hypothetical protein
MPIYGNDVKTDQGFMAGTKNGNGTTLKVLPY